MESILSGVAGSYNKFVLYAVAVALEADGFCQHHGCVVAHGGKVVSAACCEPRTKLAGQICPSLHAERAALSAAFRKRVIHGGSAGAGSAKSADTLGRLKSKHHGADLYVVRLDRGAALQGVIRLTQSKPCMDCFKAACKAGIKRIFYSDDHGNVVKVKVDHCEPSDFYTSFLQDAFDVTTVPMDRIRF